VKDASFTWCSSSARPYLDVKVGFQAAILEQLLALQGKDGGWITDFDERRKPVGLANVETTCLAILGLEASSGAK
jgi:hypothetical protein